MHGLEAEYSERMVFSYLDIDDPANDEFKAALNYRVQPHIFLLDGEGNILQQWVGFVSEQDLRAAIENYLGN